MKTFFPFVLEVFLTPSEDADGGFGVLDLVVFMSFSEADCTYVRSFLPYGRYLSGGDPLPRYL
jgi:hypothetical protein